MSELPVGTCTPAFREDDAGRLRLLFALEGDIELDHRGGTLRLAPLEWIAWPAEPLAPLSPAPARALVLSLPGSAPATLKPLARTAGGGLGSVLLSCTRSALQAAPGLTLHARAELGRSLHGLAHIAMRESVASVERLPLRGVMRERVKAYVRNNLHDNSLSIDEIAHAFHCTKRYLHKVFSEENRSLNHFIWDLRLDRCAQDLANASLGQRSITEIAFVWGFRSSAHFSRAFRQRFGASPSAYREMKAATPAPLQGVTQSPRLRVVPAAALPFPLTRTSCGR